MDEGSTFIFGVVFGLCVGAWVSSNNDSNYWKANETIVEYGCAQYNPTTSDFEWLDTLSIPKDGVSTCTP